MMSDLQFTTSKRAISISYKIPSRINIEDTNELAEAVESLRGASRGASFPDDPRCQKARDLPIVNRNWDNMLREADQVSRARLLATAQKESGAWFNALSVSSLAWDTTGL